MNMIICPKFISCPLNRIIIKTGRTILSYKYIFTIMCITLNIILDIIGTIVWNFTRNARRCFYRSPTGISYFDKFIII